MITVNHCGKGDDRFLGLTLKEGARKLFVRASTIVTLFEVLEINQLTRHAPPLFKHTFVTTSTPDENFEVIDRANDILEYL